jgi:hypothetical protein
MCCPGSMPADTVCLVSGALYARRWLRGHSPPRGAPGHYPRHYQTRVPPDSYRQWLLTPRMTAPVLREMSISRRVGDNTSGDPRHLPMSPLSCC